MTSTLQKALHDGAVPSEEDAAEAHVGNWEHELTLDDPEMQFFASTGEKKLAGSMIKTALLDLDALRRYRAGTWKPPRGTSVKQLEQVEAWIGGADGAITFADCVMIINPSYNVVDLRRAILTDPGTIERVRSMVSFSDQAEDDTPVIDSTEEELASGAPPITVGRVSLALMSLLQGDAEQDALDTDLGDLRDESSGLLRMAS